MTRSAVLLVVYALCVYRLSRLMTSDLITAPIREWLRSASHEDQVRTIIEHGTERIEERVGEIPGPALWLWELVNCSWCISPYVAAGCVLGWLYAASWFNLVALVFALSGVAGILSERV